MKASMKKVIKIMATLFGVTTGLLTFWGIRSNKKEKEQNLDSDNMYLKKEDGIEGASSSESPVKHNIYTDCIKNIFDRLAAFFGLVLLSPIFIIISIAIYIDDPGPIFFTQKRVGKGKKFFLLRKFRSMKMSTPHDVPTHMLDNPDQYITRVGKFLRKSSLDEIPQAFDVLRGAMSLVGPRPALWNQEDLVAERDKYGANDVKPGITGWAQINGRDELEIPDKAKLDGEYVKKQSLWFDFKCLVGTFISVLKSDGVVEGGTGELHKKEK